MPPPGSPTLDFHNGRWLLARPATELPAGGEQLRESAHLESPAGTAKFVIDPAKGPVEVHPQALNLDDQLASLRHQLEAM